MNRINNVFEVRDNDWVTIEVLDLDNKPHYMDVRDEDLKDYTSGILLIQQAFPYLTLEQRELIISGMTNDMWDELFGNEENL